MGNKSLEEQVVKAVDPNKGMGERTLHALQLAEDLVDAGGDIPESLKALVQEIHWQISDIAREVQNAKQEPEIPWFLTTKQEYEAFMMEWK